jgi:hypothetical protein
MVVMAARSTPKPSPATFSSTATACVVQDALEITRCRAGS